MVGTWVATVTSPMLSLDRRHQNFVRDDASLAVRAEAGTPIEVAGAPDVVLARAAVAEVVPDQGVGGTGQVFVVCGCMV
jgi:hypothetical protein